MHYLIAVAAFSLAQMMSAPFVDHLTASPDGTVLVWKMYERGQYNLYTNAGGTVHRVTPYTADDGLDIDDVSVLSSDDAVIYARGGVSDNGQGDNINPLSKLPPPVRTVYIAPLSGGTPVAVGEGLKGTVSPKNDAVAWIYNNNLMTAPLQKNGATYTVGKATQLAIRGTVQDLAWSPNGSQLAFTNNRTDHAFVVIYTPAQNRYVYATPDFTNDGSPVWSPDGKKVAFLRTPGNRSNESIYLRPVRQPWSIWVADAGSGNARKVWEARRGMGAQFYEDEGNPEPLVWLNGGADLAFLWEGDGWLHIYAVPASGGAAKRLTAGNFEVEEFVPSRDGASLYYATNEGAIDWRHIWHVGLDARPRQVTGSGPPFNEWSPQPMAQNRLAYIRASYNVPPTVMIGSQALTANLTPADFPAKDVVEPKLVTFKAPDGLTIHGQLFVPRTAGPHPGIIFDHGGPVRQMLAGFHYMDAYTFLYEENQYLTNLGFEVLSVNYRTGIMYGHDFRNPPKCCWWGSSEYQDVVAGAHFLQKQPGVDAKRIGIYGLSYGGLLTALGLARNSDIFKAGADIAGVHNWVFDIDVGYGKPTGTPAQRKVAYDASAVASIDKWTSPVLISQGDDDRNVPFAEGIDMTTRLRDKGVHVETLVFPNETHENQVWADLVRRYNAVADFLSRMLK